MAQTVRVKSICKLIAIATLVAAETDIWEAWPFWHMDVVYFVIDFRRGAELFCYLGVQIMLFALVWFSTLAAGLRTHSVLRKRASLMSAQTLRLHIQLVQLLFIQVHEHHDNAYCYVCI